MNNNYKIFLTLLSIAIASVTIPPAISFAGTAAIAQATSNSPIQPQENEQKSKPAIVTRKREQSSILEAIWKMLKAKREQEPALSSRSNVCEITPGLLGESNIIYSDRPLFLWQGKVPNLEVSLYSPFSLDKEQEIQWSQIVTADSQQALYTGEALQPGKIYDWEIVTDSQVNRRRISFQIMDAQERDLISGELAQLETELNISGATKEEIILAKANYFAQKDLWSDSLQQLYSLESAEDKAIANTQEMMSYICQSEQADFTK